MTILSDTEMFLRNPDAYRKADRMIALMESIECGPDGRSCDLGAPCPAHGCDRRGDEEWTPADEAALVDFETRVGREVTRTIPAPASDGPSENIPPASHVDLDPSGLSAEGPAPAEDCGGRDGSLVRNAIRQAYRSGIGVGYAAGVIDMRDEMSGRVEPRVDRVDPVCSSLVQLLTRLPERCDQIAEAKP